MGRDKQKTVFVFMDESGNSTMKGERKKSPSRFFGLTALFCLQEHYEDEIVPTLERWKRSSHADLYEKGIDVYLHAHDLIYGKKIYGDWSFERRKETYIELIKLMSSFKFLLITICIDKQKLAECVEAFDQADWEVAYETALALHLERIVIRSEKRYRDNNTSVRFDLTIEGRSSKQNRQVDSIYARLRKHGHKLWKSVSPEQVDRFVPLRNLSIMRKLDKIHGLELVDHLANPLLNLTMSEYGRLDNELRWQEIAVRDILGDKIDHVNGKKEGNGLKLYPLK